MHTKHVFKIRTSLEKRRPEIDFELPENNMGLEWLRVGDVLDGKAL